MPEVSEELLEEVIEAEAVADVEDAEAEAEAEEEVTEEAIEEAFAKEASEEVVADRTDEILAAIAELKNILSALAIGGVDLDENATEIEEVQNIENQYLDDAALAQALQIED